MGKEGSWRRRRAGAEEDKDQVQYVQKQISFLGNSMGRKTEVLVGAIGEGPPNGVALAPERGGLAIGLRTVSAKESARGRDEGA